MGSLVADFCDSDNLKPFSKDAIELLCIYSCRQSGDRRYLGLPELKLRAICKEASGFAQGELVLKHDFKSFSCRRF